MALPWQVVWVTGASSGIGAAVARQLADAGVKVATSARRKELLNQQALQSPMIYPYPLDVTDAVAVADTFRQIEKDIGPIDLIIAGAALYKPVAAKDIDPKDFDAMFRVNYLGVINMLAAALPVMRTRRKGHISWIASVSGYRGLPKAAAYGPTKAALINLAESLKPELEADNITISVINPGFVKTPMTADNDFKMPFLMDVEDAAQKTIAGLSKGAFEVAYPTPFVAILKIARVLPYQFYFFLMRRLDQK